MGLMKREELQWVRIKRSSSTTAVTGAWRCWACRAWHIRTEAVGRAVAGILRAAGEACKGGIDGYGTQAAAPLPTTAQHRGGVLRREPSCLLRTCSDTCQPAASAGYRPNQDEFSASLGIRRFRWKQPGRPLSSPTALVQRLLSMGDKRRTHGLGKRAVVR